MSGDTGPTGCSGGGGSCRPCLTHTRHINSVTDGPLCIHFLAPIYRSVSAIHCHVCIRMSLAFDPSRGTFSFRVQTSQQCLPRRTFSQWPQGERVDALVRDSRDRRMQRAVPSLRLSHSRSLSDSGSIVCLLYPTVDDRKSSTGKSISYVRARCCRKVS